MRAGFVDWCLALAAGMLGVALLSVAVPRVWNAGALSTPSAAFGTAPPLPALVSATPPAMLERPARHPVRRASPHPAPPPAHPRLARVPPPVSRVVSPAARLAAAARAAPMIRVGPAAAPAPRRRAPSPRPVSPFVGYANTAASHPR